MALVGWAFFVVVTSFVVLCVFLVVFWLCGQLGVPFLGVALFTSGGSGRSCFVCGHVRSFVSAIACRRASLRWLHHSRVVGTAIMRGCLLYTSPSPRD